MEELIAKRYIKAIKHGTDIESMKKMTAVFSALAESFKDAGFVQVIGNPSVSKSQKSEILLEATKSADSKEIDNLIKLLVENNRINIIPAIAESMRKDVADTTKTYYGIVYSDSNIDVNVLQDLSAGLSKKFDSNISLEFVKNDFDGIKVDVEDLGIEINFSKTRINSQIIKHIVKAI
ncbi:F0F1 ATP synthase subunit delta [bacterium]|nr:F0F1 ATP synthase subunit delta [bacterium]MBU1990902.1 F0F1 ATP synthase subunit delta [bacterium]